MANVRTYMWEPQPPVATKGEGHKTSVPVGVATWSRPASNVGPGGKVRASVYVDNEGKQHHLKTSDPYGSTSCRNCKRPGRRSAFNPRPLKVWRKRLNPVPGSGGGRPGIGNPMDRPGGSTIRRSLIDKDPKDIHTPPGCCSSQLIEAFQPLEPGWKPPGKGTRDRSNTSACGPTCTACNPEAHVIRRATTVLSKKYYTDSRAYLRSRGKRFDQNLGSGAHIHGLKYANSAGDVLYNNGDPSRANGAYGGLQCPPGSNCPPLPPAHCGGAPIARDPPGRAKPRHIYKPNNRPFGVQGAVESSTRLDRLKLNTIQRSISSAKSFGPTSIDGARYTGRAGAARTVKSDWSNGTCKRVSQGKTKCFRLVSNNLGTAPASRIPAASAGERAWSASMRNV